MSPFDSAWLISAVGLTVPILWAALGELISERGGVLNIGLEGMVLVGAFCSYLVAWETHSAWLGVLGAVAGGMLMAAVMAAVSINGRGDQIVVGLGLFILGGGATAFAFEQIFDQRGRIVVDHMSPLKIPLLADIPGVGKALFDQVPLAYLAFLAVPLVWYLLFRTRWGLAVRAAGEYPEAVEASGMSVARARWTATLCAGIGGGLAGAMLTVGSLGTFTEGASAGRGFIALAAVVFGRWKPLGVLGACFVFGAADALQLRLQAIGDVPSAVWVVIAVIAVAAVAAQFRGGRRPATGGVIVPALVVVAGVVLAIAQPTIDLASQVWLMLPYLLALVVLAGVIGRARVPSALGLPYPRPTTE